MIAEAQLPKLVRANGCIWFRDRHRRGRRRCGSSIASRYSATRCGRWATSRKPPRSLAFRSIACSPRPPFCRADWPDWPACRKWRASRVNQTLDLSPGFGYTGIVVAMLALLHPLGVIAAAVFVAAVFVGADAMSRSAVVPSYIAQVMVAVSLLSMVTAVMLTRYRMRWR